MFQLLNALEGVDMTYKSNCNDAKCNKVHLAWTGFQRRQESMRHVVGFDCWFFPTAKGGRLSKLVSYVQLFFKSLRDLRLAAPQEVWVQLPQVPPLWAALLYRVLFNPTAKIIADCHNAQLRAPWNRFPLALWSLRRSDIVLVHNEAMFEQAKTIDWPMEKVLILEDIPPTLSNIAPQGLARQVIDAPKPWVVFPGSFAADEPIAEVMAAARLAPEMTFIITGRPDRAARNGHDLSSLPSNMRLPGFLSVEVFDDLLRDADVILGLTREEGIQLSVCNEALGFKRPLVTSDTAILRQLFSEAAVMVKTSDPASIAAGCRSALEGQAARSKLSSNLAEKRLCKWIEGQFASVKKAI